MRAALSTYAHAGQGPVSKRRQGPSADATPMSSPAHSTQRHHRGPQGPEAEGSSEQEPKVWLAYAPRTCTILNACAPSATHWLSPPTPPRLICALRAAAGGL
eukprot:8916056-Pyramimonas_sp.AAC.1